MLRSRAKFATPLAKATGSPKKARPGVNALEPELDFEPDLDLEPELELEPDLDFEPDLDLESELELEPEQDLEPELDIHVSIMNCELRIMNDESRITKYEV